MVIFFPCQNILVYFILLDTLVASQYINNLLFLCCILMSICVFSNSEKYYDEHTYACLRTHMFYE